MKKIKKETKRKIRTGIIFLAIAIVLALVGSLFLGIKIRFALRDELNIRLDPLDLSLNVKNNEPFRITIDVMNNNFLQCKTNCEFTLTDLADNNVLHSDSRVLSHNEEITKYYDLPAPGKGEGQLIYSFEAKCNNIKSVVCLTREERRYRSAIVTVNYGLSEEEKAIKNETKQDIESWLNVIKDAYKISKETEVFSERLGGMSEKRSITAKNNELKGELDKIKSERDAIISLWNSEEYISLAGRFTGEDIEKADNLWDRLFKLQSDAVGVVFLRLENIDLLKEVTGLKQNILNAVNFYKKENNANNNRILSNMNAAAGKVNLNYAILNENIQHYESAVRNELITQLNAIKTFVNDSEETIAEGTFLLVFGEKILEVKNTVSSLSPSYDFDCDKLNSLLTRINDENDDANDFRLNYSSSVDDELLEKVQLEIEIEALQRTKSYINNSFLDNKEILLEMVDREISARRKPRYITLIPKPDLYKMSLIDDAELSAYIGENCGSTNQTADTGEINKLLSLDVSAVKEIDASMPNVTLDEPTALGENFPECCVFGECVECCDECDDEITPVLFIHGHVVNDANTPEFAMTTFAKIQKKFQEEGYVNVGELDVRVNPYEVMEGEWGRSKAPISVRASYYYITHYDVGAYSVEMQKSERIENYAIRLKEMINLLKYRTGARKINLVAHSMGGLVARQYMDLFGADSINKIITVNTPHHGISGKVKTFCSVLGASKECTDMSDGSIFLERLNSKKLPDVEFHVIRSTGCEMDNGKNGDGIVTEESAYLDGAENYLIEGKCADTLQTSLHTSALEPDIYPETYKLILSILEE